MFKLTLLRCSGPAWLAGWVTAVFLPSALIAGLGLSEPAAALGDGFQHLPAATWKVADDVGPAAKLLLGSLLALCFLVSERLASTQAASHYAGNVAAGLLAISSTLYLIPAAYSRGFGVGLTGSRFDSTTFPLYLVGGAAAGLVFTYALIRCDRKERRKVGRLEDDTATRGESLLP